MIHEMTSYNSPSGHVPVLLNPMLETLSPVDGGIYLDGTFGGGGYTKAILEKANCIVHAIDRDPQAIQRALILKQDFPERFFIHHGTFLELSHIFSPNTFDGIVFDFGVSSFQIDDANRGFSFRYDGPLDMRMNPDTGIDAATIVNTYSEADLADIIYTYGEEPYAKRVAKAIVTERKIKPFTSTAQLAQCVRSNAHKKKDIDSATLTFQGLRIFVNNELIEIDGALKSSVGLLKNRGTIVTVSFHSLEDRLCKQFFKNSAMGGLNTHFKSIIKKPVAPTLEEIRKNPRSRSAKLRAVLLDKEYTTC